MTEFDDSFFPCDQTQEIYGNLSQIGSRLNNKYLFRKKMYVILD